ncbi:MAG: STAS domain-containing protein [Wenzhouxiangella sp.]|nr:STAS domain-containing protein [Wenzhouxiangella sp.]MCH8477474.1 STAS domain-containing protein [Wenzhouxiangella sp.]
MATPEQAFALTGKLDPGAVAAVWRASRAAAAAGKLPDSIDLGSITQCDSATLALLLEWQARAHSQGGQIEFTNPPESLLVLARLSQAEQLLGWGPAEQSPSGEQA